MNRTAHAQWALEQIIDIDRYTPFCGAFFRASGERRQVIAAYLSAKPPSQQEMAQVGKFLLEADHRSILAAAHGEYGPSPLEDRMEHAPDIDRLTLAATVLARTVCMTLLYDSCRDDFLNDSRALASISTLECMTPV